MKIGDFTSIRHFLVIPQNCPDRHCKDRKYFVLLYSDKFKGYMKSELDDKTINKAFSLLNPQVDNGGYWCDNEEELSEEDEEKPLNDDSK